MNLRVNTTLATAVSLILFAGCASAANIVYNGDFEGGTYVGPNGDIVPNGWTDGPPYPASLSNLNVENTVNSDQGPESGTNYVAYMSTAPSGKDCLYQDLTTVAGQQYDLSFWVAFTASNTGVGPNVGMDVVWDEQGSNYTLLDNSEYSAPSNTGPVGYEEFTYVATASSTDTRIDFHGVETNGAILLDNVSVSPVSSAPEPVSLVLTGAALLLVGVLPNARKAALTRSERRQADR